MNTLPSLPPSGKNGATALLLSAIATFGFGLGAGFGSSVVSAMNKNNPAPIASRCVSLEQYNRLEMGFPQSQVELILQPGIEESRSTTTAIIKWQNKDGSYIRATFEGNKLKNKEQKGLSIYKPCPM